MPWLAAEAGTAANTNSAAADSSASSFTLIPAPPRSSQLERSNYLSTPQGEAPLRPWLPNRPRSGEPSRASSLMSGDAFCPVLPSGRVKGTDVRVLSRARPGAVRAAAALRGARRDALHHRSPGLRALVQRAPARADIPAAESRSRSHGPRLGDSQTHPDDPQDGRRAGRCAGVANADTIPCFSQPPPPDKWVRFGPVPHAAG